MLRPVALGLGLSVVLGVGACSSGDQKGELEWVAGLRPGDCVDPGTRPSVAIVRMRVVPCREGHAMEVYARLPYPPVATASASVTPTSSATATSTTTLTPSAASKQPGSAAGFPLGKAAVAAPTPAVATASSSEYPGRDVLRLFAREACAEHFRAYLGSNPRDPSYFLTYLFPSVASWSAASEQRPKLGPLARLVTTSARSDRSVVCFVRTTGRALTASVRGHAPASATTTPSPTASAGQNRIENR